MLVLSLNWTVSTVSWTVSVVLLLNVLWKKTILDETCICWNKSRINLYTVSQKNNTKKRQVCVHPHSPGECGWLWTEPVSYSNVQSDDLWPSRMHAATHILQEKTHACGVLKRHNFRVYVSLGSVETLVRRGGIINHHSIAAYSLSNISAKNYRNLLMWVESIVCNISVVFLRHSVEV